MSVLSVRAADQFVTFTPSADGLTLYAAGSAVPVIWCSDDDHKGVLMAVENLQADFERVVGVKAGRTATAAADVKILVGSADQSPLIKQLIKAKKLDKKQLQGAREKYIITTLHAPLEGIEGDVLLIAGSDKRAYRPGTGGPTCPYRPARPSASVPVSIPTASLR